MTDEIHQSGTTDFRPDILDGVSRRTLLKASGVGMGGLALGASANSVAAQEEEEGDEADPFADLSDSRVPYLDLDTLEAEFEGETLQAESAENLRSGSTTYVGEAAGRSGLFVAVSHVDDETDAVEQPAIVAYLCDGEVGAQGDIGLWLAGEFDETGTTLTGEEGQDGEVRLALVDGEFLGAAGLPDEEERVPFVTSEATGDSGLYQAETEVDETEVTVRWVVLPDGRQRGMEWCCAYIDGIVRCGWCVVRH